MTNQPPTPATPATPAQPPSDTPVVDFAALGRDLVRVIVPFVVAFIIGLLAHLGIKADTATVTAYVVAIGGVLLTGLARYLEAKFPKVFGRILVFERMLTITKN